MVEIVRCIADSAATWITFQFSLMLPEVRLLIDEFLLPHYCWLVSQFVLDVALLASPPPNFAGVDEHIRFSLPF